MATREISYKPTKTTTITTNSYIFINILSVKKDNCKKVIHTAYRKEEQKMKFTADKKLLEKSITPVALGVAPKNTDPLLEGIYLEVKDGVLIMCSYDREKGIRTKLAVDMESEGKIVVDAQKTSAIIHSLPNGPVTIETDENLIMKIYTDEADFQISGKDATNYPGLPDVVGELDFTLQQNKIRNMINKTLFAVSTDDSKPLYTGSLFEIKGNLMRITALDGFRISMREEEGLTERDDLDLRFIMPGKAQNDLLRLIDDSEQPISVSMARKHIIFTFDNIYYITRLLDGEFLDYKKKIPSHTEIKAKINTSRFINSIERAALIIDEKIKSSIKLNFADGAVNISCNTMLGKFKDEFSIDMEGTSMEIGFNHKILIDALRACGEEKISVSLSHNLGPMIITPEEGSEGNPERFLYLILPVQLKSN